MCCIATPRNSPLLAFYSSAPTFETPMSPVLCFTASWFCLTRLTDSAARYKIWRGNSNNSTSHTHIHISNHNRHISGPFPFQSNSNYLYLQSLPIRFLTPNTIPSQFPKMKWTIHFVACVALVHASPPLIARDTPDVGSDCTFKDSVSLPAFVFPSDQGTLIIFIQETQY